MSNQDNPTTPKLGSIERAVLQMLIDKPEGVTYLDFPPELGITDEKLAEVILCLQHGLYESEDDDKLRFDA